MFAYCRNNPVNFSDVTGTLPEWAQQVGGVLLGAAAGALAAFILVALAPEVICATTLSLTVLGISAGTAEAVASVGVCAVAADVTLYAMDSGYSTVTGQSPVRESMGDDELYEIWQTGSLILAAGYGQMAALGSQLGVCFIEGTLIHTDAGTITIQDIKPGDLVWVWNEDDDTVSLKPVLETYINATNELVHLTVLGELITCTPNHPFYVPQRGWIDAVHLRVGDILVLLNGEYVVLEKVQHELLETPVTVYNFKVADDHTYYVGTNGVRVHNANCGNESIAGKYRPLSRNEIRQLGGEKTTAMLKKSFGGSLSDLRIDSAGNVYAVRKGELHGNFIGTFSSLVEDYGNRGRK